MVVVVAVAAAGLLVPLVHKGSQVHKVHLVYLVYLVYRVYRVHRAHLHLLLPLPKTLVLASQKSSRWTWMVVQGVEVVQGVLA